jgi:hypothetical protein
MPRRSRSYRTEQSAREARARTEGWASYGQKRYWTPRLTDARVREYAEQIGGPVELDRAGSLMSRRANEIVNPQSPPRDFDWRVRLLAAAGKIGPKRRAA